MTASAGLHNLPTELRAAVRAEPGHVLVRADLGQIEPRVLAVVSGDRALAAATRADDLYAPVARELGVDRDTAKVAVLGAMYGQTTGRGGDMRRRLTAAYPVAMAYLDDADHAARSGRPLRTYGGRAVPDRLPDRDAADASLTADEARRRAAARGRYGRNALVQGAAAELFKLWAVTVRARAAVARRPHRAVPARRAARPRTRVGGRRHGAARRGRPPGGGRPVGARRRRPLRRRGQRARPLVRRQGLSEDAASERSHGMTRHGADVDRRAEWDALRARHLVPPEQRPPSSARGVHHLALLSRDVERTIAFYQDLLEFPLTELFENRDYQGSTHFFFDIGHGNLLAFFDFPGLDLDAYAEVLGGLHHLAISVEPERWEHLRGKLDAAGVPYEEMSGSSLYFRGPDGERIELIRDPLGEMYGTAVL